MKNLLILIVVTALFLHFYPQPKLEAWYIEQKNTALDTFAELSDTQVRLKADKIFHDLEPQFDSFSTQEVNYLKQITQSREEVKTFFNAYCATKKPSPKFHSTNQKKVCRAIEKYQSLF